MKSSHWQKAPLGNVCDVIAGGTPSRKNPKYFGGDIAWVKISDMLQGAITATDETITKAGLENSAAKILPAGTILISIFATIGRTAVLEIEAATNQAIVGVIPKPEIKLNTSFLRYALDSSILELTKEARGVAQININGKILKSLEIPLPPLPEQERIVRLLDEAESLRATRLRANERMEQFVPALFNEMFGVGKFPDTKLSDLCHFITKGTTPKSKDIKDEATEIDDVPFLKVYHITDDGDIDFHYHPSFISKAIHNNFLKRSIVYPNDVLMNIVGPPLGKIGLVPSEYNEWNINQAVAIFRAKEQVDPRYLLHALRHKPILNKLLGQAVGIRQYNLSLVQCRNFMIPLPPLTLQREFAARVGEARAVLSAQEISAERIEVLYQSMLSRAFAGAL